MVEITLPDGNIKKFSKGITVYNIAKEISEGLARNVLSAKFNNQIVETSTKINENGSLTFEVFSNSDETGLLYSYNTGNVPRDEKWHEYRFNFNNNENTQDNYYESDYGCSEY